MDEKLTQIEEKYEKLTAQMSDPAIYGDMEKYTAAVREQKELEPVVEAWREVKRLKASAGEARALLDREEDEELRALAKDELELAEAALPEAERQEELPF